MKKIVLLTVLLVFVFAMPVHAATKFEIFRLTDASYFPTGPSTYEGTIAWTSGYQLYYWDGNSITNVASVSTHKTSSPSLYDGTIAWSDSGNVYYWDGNGSGFKLANGGVPTLYDGTIAWYYHDGNDGEIYYWDGSVKTQISDNSTSADSSPSLYDGTIAWDAYNGINRDIYYWDGNSITNVTNRDNITDQACSLYNSTIAWQGHEDSNYSLYYWDGSLITEVIRSGTGFSSISLYDGTIAWCASDGNDDEIYFWDGIDIYQVTNNDTPDQDPSLHNGIIAWICYTPTVTPRWGIYYAKIKYEPTIAITSPNGGEALSAGTIHEITWTSEGDIEYVRIEFSCDNGTNWTEIVASTENDGLYDWEIPCKISEESLIRISDVDDDPSDVSDEVFSISCEPPPCDIDAILTFFDASVADGTLVGYGPGKSASGRRKALRNMIEAAGGLIDDGYIEEACQQLLDAYHRTDGVRRPPEFVAGQAAPTLAGMILELRECLECE